jgi:hypothetical protein
VKGPARLFIAGERIERSLDLMMVGASLKIRKLCIIESGPGMF